MLLAWGRVRFVPVLMRDLRDWHVTFQTSASPVAMATSTTAGTLPHVLLRTLALLLRNILRGVSPVAMTPQISMVTDMPVGAVTHVFETCMFLPAPAFAVSMVTAVF